MAQTQYEISPRKNYAIMISDLFYQQAGFDQPFDQSLIDYRHPLVKERVFHAVPMTKEQTPDCTGEYIKIEKVTSRISRFTITFDATAKLVAGWGALGFGIAAAPTGTPQNEIQNLKSAATAGNHKFNLDFEGLSEFSGNVPFNSTPAQLKAALEATRSIKENNVNVTGTALNHVSGLNVEFVNGLRNCNLPLITKNDTGATGGVSTITAVQNGANKLHLISRMTGEKPPQFCLIEGFAGSSEGAKMFKNLVVGSFDVRAVRKGKLTITVVAYGSAVPIPLVGYTIPECDESSDPIMVADCRFSFGGTFVADDLQECGYSYNNNIDLSDPTRFDSIDIKDLEIGDRTSQFTATILGNDTATLLKNILANPNGYFTDARLDCGIPGERVSFIAPNVQWSLNETPIDFIGTKGKSAFAVIGRPSPSSGVVDRIEYHGDNDEQYLQVAP